MGDAEKQSSQEMEQIKEYGQAVLNNPNTNHQIHLLNKIGRAHV